MKPNKAENTESLCSSPGNTKGSNLRYARNAIVSAESTTNTFSTILLHSSNFTFSHLLHDARCFPHAFQFAQFFNSYLSVHEHDLEVVDVEHFQNRREQFLLGYEIYVAPLRQHRKARHQNYFYVFLPSDKKARNLFLPSHRRVQSDARMLVSEDERLALKELQGLLRSVPVNYVVTLIFVGIEQLHLFETLGEEGDKIIVIPLYHDYLLEVLREKLEQIPHLAVFVIGAFAELVLHVAV